jgi:hypothetical protein
MFVEFEKDATVGQTAFAVNVDNVIKIEPSPPKTGLRGEPTTVLTYIDGISDTFLV